MPVGVERVHARKLVKPSGRAHDTDSAGDGPLAFVRTNRGRRDMQRRQRRSTRGVDTDGWADEAQAVRDSARGTQLSAADDTHSTVCVDFADRRPVFVGEMPMKQPASDPSTAPGLSPVFSSALHATRMATRCCGSIATASRWVMP